MVTPSGTGFAGMETSFAAGAAALHHHPDGSRGTLGGMGHSGGEKKEFALADGDVALLGVGVDDPQGDVALDRLPHRSQRCNQKQNPMLLLLRCCGRDGQ